MSKNIRAAALLLLAASSCTVVERFAERESLEDLPQPVSMRVFAARGFLGATDYERYVVKDNVLWRECGNVRDPKKKADKQKHLEGDDVLAYDPSLIIVERRSERLTRKDLHELIRSANKFLSVSNKPKAPPPGGVRSIVDTGNFELTVQVVERSRNLVTSIDALSDPQTPNLEAAKDLFSAIRRIGPTICGNETFYTIGK